jgi:hypothetical protein
MSAQRFSLGSWGVLESEVDFPELATAREEPTFRFRIGNPTTPLAVAGREIQRWDLPDGQEWLRIYDAGLDYLFTFPGYAHFAVSENFGDAACYPQHRVQRETLRHLFLDQVLPLMMAARGETVLHGSAVTIAGKAVVFLGVSGAGKSTIAVKLASLGYPLLTDDCLLVRFGAGEMFACPSYPGARLFTPMIRTIFERNAATSAVAQYTSKRRIDLDQTQLKVQGKAVPVGAVFVVTEGHSDVAGRTLDGSERLVELAKYRYRIDPTNQDELRKEFPALVRLAQYPCFEFRYRRSPESLQQIEARVLTALKND